ncbi:hypothetical protein D3C71_1118340 [compost metagenome]
MLLQIIEGLRCAAAVEVIGAGNHHQLGVLQRPGDQTGVRNRAHANGQVIALADKIDIAITDVRLNLHIRKPRAKGRHQRQDPVVGVGGRDTDAQSPGRHLLLAHDFTLGFHQLCQRLAAFFVVASAAVGQFDAASGAREQPHAQTFLHARHRATHRSRRNPRHQRRCGETAGLGGQAKQLDAAQLKIVELSLHD